MDRDCEFEPDIGFRGDAFAAADVGRRLDGEVAVAGCPSEGDVREGVVKWFRSDKGYGFVALSGGMGDAFLHLKALRAIGREFGRAWLQGKRDGRRRASRDAGHKDRGH